MTSVKKLIIILTSAAIVFAALAATASARTPSARNPAHETVLEPGSVAFGSGLPIFHVPNWQFVPPEFSTDAAQAVEAAEHNRTMLAIHAKEHPLIIMPQVWLGRGWTINFSYRGKVVADVTESKAAHVKAVWQGPEAIALYARGDYATPFGHIWVLLPFCLMFLLVFVDPRRWLRMAHLDALAVLSLLVSYLLFDHAKLVPAVWAVYPPLLYLTGRLLWLGGLRLRRRGTARAERPQAGGLSPMLPTWALAGGLVVLVLARTALGLLDHTVIDVGYASVIGAHQIVHGGPIYFAAANNGDTYGPIAYLAYVPFELLFPWNGAWNYLPSAHAASLVFDLVTIGGLVLLGRRFRPGRQGLRLGLAFGWAFAACPFTLLALMMHSNDGLIAMLSVLSLLVFSSPGARGAMLGLAAAAKFAPGALLGIYARGRRTGLKGALACVASFAVIVIGSIWLYLPKGGLTEFYDQTIRFQLNRTDVFSPWALHPGLDPIKTAIEVAVLLLCAVLAFFPRERSLRQLAALAGAVTIAIQIPAVHWFYFYIVWFIPYVVVAVLADDQAPPAHEGVEDAVARDEDRALAIA